MTVRVSVLPLIDVAPLYLGIEQGFFEDENITVEVQLANSGAATVASLLSDEVQFAYTGVIPFMIARSQNVPIAAVTNAQLQNSPEDQDTLERGNADILVADSSPIQTAADLEGRTIALNALAGVQEVLLRNTLDVAGVPQDSVQLVELATPTMVDALSNGTVDAAFVNEPFETIGLSQGLRIAATPFLDLEYPANLSIYVTSQQFASGNQDVVERFGRAVNEASTYAQENPDEAREQAATYTTVPENVLADVLLPYWTPDISRESIQEQADLAVRYDVLPEAPDVDELFSDIITD
ncbi:ABC transporter substrate-binding protein [Klenkia sp. LSe6-5]|uniref:ABC transporter substrate-binding protein n=1 Tax=Klenkia sesuvii TaxID=3103137 RepID=A0ABU8DZA6_9ACTN